MLDGTNAFLEITEVRGIKIIAGKEGLKMPDLPR